MDPDLLREWSERRWREAVRINLIEIVTVVALGAPLCVLTWWCLNWWTG